MQRSARKFDVIVIGAGSGLEISSYASSIGLKTAIVEEGPFGGTCLNRGCIPSKLLIHNADVIETINKAKDLGIYAGKITFGWKKIINRAVSVDKDAKDIEEGNEEDKNITVFKGRGEFIGFKQLKVGKDIITAKKIFICAGSRTMIPEIPGLQGVDYITSTEALRLEKQPKDMIIVGGGYIGAELAHFFGTLGTKITILQRNIRMVPNEDWELADKYTEIARKKFSVVLQAGINKVWQKGSKKFVEYESAGKKKTISAEQLLIATGRVPNTDTLKIDKTNVKLNDKGFVKVNEFLETNVPGIWAIGDIAGIYLFKHSANLEAAYAIANAFGKSRVAVDYYAMPHAVFSSPQMAGVGMTERELQDKKIPHIKAVYKYYDTAMGFTLDDKEGFVKLLCDPRTKKFLGCYIMGSDASTLIHELVLAMRAGLTAEDVRNTVHVHPALPEVIQRACASLDFK